ncbi:hypothetical protein U1Q18_005579, partial [Sarracenia purpurea var. burkii]
MEGKTHDDQQDQNYSVSSPTESTEVQAVKEPVQWSKQQHRRINQLIRNPQCKGPLAIEENRLGLSESNGRKLGESSGGKPGESKVEETQEQPKQSTAISGESIQNERNQGAIGGRGAGRDTTNLVGGQFENLLTQSGGQRAEREASMIEGGKSGNQFAKIRGQGAGRFNPEQKGEDSFWDRPRKEGRCLPSLHPRLLAVNEGDIDGRGNAALRESLILGEERDNPTMRDSNQKNRKSAFSNHIPNWGSAREGKEDRILGEVNGGSEENFMEIDSGTDLTPLKGIEKESGETNNLQVSLRKKKARARQFRPHSKSVVHSALNIKRSLDEEERQEYPGEIKKAKFQKTYQSE